MITKDTKPHHARNARKTNRDLFRVFAFSCISCISWYVVAAAQTQSRPADTILVNGHVITVDTRFSIAQAVAIANGRFMAVGANADIRKLAGPKTATIDLLGQTV